MAVDRGGLNYSIKVRDEFSKNTIKFRTELAKAKRAFKEFRTEQARSVKNAGAAEREQLRVSQQQLRLEREKLRNREVQARIERQNAAERRRINREQIRAQERVEAAERRTNRERNRAIQRQRRLTSETARTSKEASGLLFKFRRLVGTLAVFTIAREAVSGFNQLVASAVRFNDTIEGSTLGVAGLISAIGQVRDSQGNLVEGADAFNVAIGISRKQIAALRQDSLKTVATFEELLETFQVAVGPGLAAGLGLDEVRTLSVQISQAATALQVPQNQLAEEIRSLLSGTIQARTTRIATALGITNEDVRQLKEAGTLFEELNDRLKEFSLAAETAARSTVGGISTLLKGALQEALGAAAGGLTQELLASLGQALDGVVTIRDELGNLVPNPRFVQAFEKVFDAIARSLAAARELAGRAGFKTLEGILQGIAFTIDIITGALLGIGEIVAAVVRPFQAISEATGFSSDNLGQSAQNTAKWGVQLLVVAKLVTTIRNTLGGITGAFTLLNAGAVAGFAAAIGGVLLSIDGIIESVTGVNTSLKDSAQLVVLGLAKAAVFTLGVFEQIKETIGKGLSSAITQLVTAAKKSLLETRVFINTLLGDDEEARELSSRIITLERQTEESVAAIKRDGKAKVAAIEARKQGLLDALNAEIAAILNAADPNTTPGDGPAPAAAPGGTATPDPAADPQIEERLRKLRREQALLAAQARAATIGTGPVDGGVRDAQALLEISREQLEVKRAEAREELRILINKSKQLPIGGEARDQILELISALGRRNFQEDKILLAKIKQGELDVEALRRQEQLAAAERRRAREQERNERKRRLAEEQRRLTGGTGDGVVQGFEDFGNRFASQFESGIRIATGVLNSFTNLVSSSIVDAFDPTQDFDIKERFARFLQDISRLILTELVKVALAKRALAAQTATAQAGANFGVTTSANILGSLFGGGIAFAKGGLVPHESRSARGYAGGGLSRPSHVPASDTIPAWLTPGEFVMSKGAVKNLGLDTLSALNSGNIGVTGSGDAASPSAGGMASGGLVRDSITGNSGGGGGVVLPAIVANERTMSQLNSGGRRAQLKFMQQNNSTIGGLVPSRRRKKR